MKRRSAYPQVIRRPDHNQQAPDPQSAAPVSVYGTKKTAAVAETIATRIHPTEQERND